MVGVNIKQTSTFRLIYVPQMDGELGNQDALRIFVKGDHNKEPVRFYLHGSLTLNQQEKLALDIEVLYCPQCYIDRGLIFALRTTVGWYVNLKKTQIQY